MATNNAINSKSLLQHDTGFQGWNGAGPYFDDTTLGEFTVSQGGSGYIKGVRVTWSAPQTVTGMTAGNTYYIYIDDTGTIGKTTTRNETYEDYIVLFECLRDSTPVTNNQLTVRDNHPYEFTVFVSNWAHDIIGSVIENSNNGANITLNGTQKIQINGDDELNDHGLRTDIPDSSGVGVTFVQMYTTAGGAWARYTSSDTFAGFYNNAGTPTAIGNNKYGIYTLYVSKDNANTTTPTYIAVLDDSQYNNLTSANTAISNGTQAMTSNELSALEIAQLGYIIYSESATAIVSVIIAKQTLQQTISTSGTNTASLINTTTTNFDGILSSSDTNVQAALETIDESGIPFTEVTGGTQAAATNRGYITNNAGLVTVTLPATASVGDRIAIVGQGAGLFLIAQNNGQTVHMISSDTTTGVGGSLASTNRYDCVELVCTVTDTDFVVRSSMGNITVV